MEAGVRTRRTVDFMTDSSGRDVSSGTPYPTNALGLHAAR